MIKLKIPLEGNLPKGVKDIFDEDCLEWRKGHIYEVPKDFYVNEDYFEDIEKKPSKVEKTKEK